MEKYNLNRPSVVIDKASHAPPSFNHQAQIGSFKRNVGFLTSVKNKVSSLLRKQKTDNKSLSSYNVQKISSIDNYGEIDHAEMIIIDSELDENKAFKLNSSVKNNILDILKGKGFSAIQAISIFNREFKKCRSYDAVNKVIDDIPSIEIYEMGFNRETDRRNHLKEKLEYLVSLGYDKEQSEQVIVDAYNQSSSKKEFNNYLNSIPRYEDYNKGYFSPKDVKNVSKKATKHLLKIGYSKDATEDIIQEIGISRKHKDDFLRAIKNVPKPAIKNKGYDTVGEYIKMQNACRDRLQTHLGYSYRKAEKIAIEYQKNSPSSSEFMFKINSIHKPIK